MTENSSPENPTDTIKEARNKIKHQSKGLSYVNLIMTDVLSMIFGLGPGLLTWFSTILYVRRIWDSEYFMGLIWLAPLVLVFTFLITTFIFRMFVPKMKPGVYRLGFSRDFAAWYLTLCLGHGIRIFGLQPFFFTFYITKYLYWRAMGANIAYGVNSSLFLTLVDYPLITIKRGFSCGAYVHVACHTFVGDKLFLAPVTIEENVYLGMNTTVGPKSTIGEGSWIGFSNRIFQDRLPAGTKLDNFEWEYGNPKKIKK